MSNGNGQFLRARPPGSETSSRRVTVTELRDPRDVTEGLRALRHIVRRTGYSTELNDDALICRDEVCQITVCQLSRPRAEGGNVRAARRRIVDARSVGSSGGHRSRYVVESLGSPHAYPPNWRGRTCAASRRTAVADRADLRS